MEENTSVAARRLVLMLALPDVPASVVREAMSSQADAVAKEASRAGAQLRIAAAVDDDPTAAAAGERIVAPVHAVVELSAPADAPLLDVAATLPGLLPTEVDWSGSAVAAGTIHTVLPGAKSLLLVLGARRLPTITSSDFHEYWLGRHAQLALSLLDDDRRARMAYAQLHADESVSQAAAAVTGIGHAGYDGVLEVGLNEFLDLPHATVPGFAEAIFEDEQHFADQSAEMRGGLLQILHREDR